MSYGGILREEADTKLYLKDIQLVDNWRDLNHPNEISLSDKSNSDLPIEYLVSVQMNVK